MCDLHSLEDIASLSLQDPSMMDTGANAQIPGRWRKGSPLDTMVAQEASFTEGSEQCASAPSTPRRRPVQLSVPECSLGACPSSSSTSILQGREIRRFEAQAPGVVSSKSVYSQGSLNIAEFFGTSSTGDSRLSACLATASIRRDGSTEEYQTYQTPESDEYVMVINGELLLDRAGVKGSVKQGQGILLKAGERVCWSWARPSQYVIICLPPISNEVRPADIEGDIETRRFDVLVPEGCKSGDWLQISLPAAGIRPESSDACIQAKPAVLDCGSQVSPPRMISEGIQARPYTGETGIQFSPEMMQRATQAQPSIEDNCTQIDAPILADFGAQVSPPPKDPGIEIGLQAAIRLSETDFGSQASPEASPVEIQATPEFGEMGIQVSSAEDSKGIPTVAPAKPKASETGPSPSSKKKARPEQGIQTSPTAKPKAAEQGIQVVAEDVLPSPPIMEILQGPERELKPSKSRKKKKKGTETQAVDTTDVLESCILEIAKTIAVPASIAKEIVELAGGEVVQDKPCLLPDTCVDKPCLLPDTCAGVEPETKPSKSRKKKKKGAQVPAADTTDVCETGTCQSEAGIQDTPVAVLGTELGKNISPGKTLSADVGTQASTEKVASEDASSQTPVKTSIGASVQASPVTADFGVQMSKLTAAALIQATVMCGDKGSQTSPRSSESTAATSERSVPRPNGIVSKLTPNRSFSSSSGSNDQTVSPPYQGPGNLPDYLQAGAEMIRVNSLSAFDQIMDNDALIELRGKIEEQAVDRPARYGARHLNTPIVIVASEINPWSKTGGLAMVAGSYAYEFAIRGHRTMAVSPRYKDFPNCEFAGRTQIWLDGQMHEVQYYHQRQEFGAGKGCDFIFVDHHCYKNRAAGLYGDPTKGGEYEDNCFRFALLTLAATEAPLVVNIGGSTYGQEVCFIANDWQTGLLPVYLLYKYKRNKTYQKARSMLVLHNMGYQGRYRKSKFPADRFFGLPSEAEHELQGEDVHFGQDCINLLGAGIKLADRILTVSPNYAREIQTAEGGHGLHQLLKEKASQDRVRGILNGISDEWNPSIDEYIAKRYGVNDFVEGKAACKAALQKELGLIQDPNLCLIGFCGRLCYQKGIHLIVECIGWLMQNQGNGVNGRAQIVLMGKGDPGYESQLRSAEAAHRGKVCGYVGFDPQVEHRMMAGCDLLLMPSQYEPCGLPQMYAQQYAALPVVHETGGLKDSVQGLGNDQATNATGFLFTGFEVNRLKERLYQAMDVFHHKPDLWHKMQLNAIQADNYWPQAIDEYEKNIDKVMEDPPYRS